MPDLTGRRIAITGANSGIGKVCTRELAREGAEVLMICRSQARAESARREILAQVPDAKLTIHLCDMASQASIQACGLALREQYDALDALLNNHGAMFGDRRLTEDDLEMTFAVDHLGYLLLTHYLLDLIRAGSVKRIVNVSSEAHRFVKSVDWDNLQGERRYTEFGAYGLAKLGNLYFTRELARRIKPEGITVNALHPGFVASNFGKGSSLVVRLLMPLMKLLAISPEKGAETSLYLLRSDEVADITGAYFKDQQKVHPSGLAQLDDLTQQFWQHSLQLCGLKAFGQVPQPQT